MTTFDKRTLRQVVKAEIAQLTKTEKAELSAQIFSKIAELQDVRQASVVALFASLPDEPQTAAIIEQLAQSKRLVLPRIEGDEMEFYDISEGLHEGAFGIMEPVATTPIEPNLIDVMIVPGVAFTRSGARLGRGKGFYDKYMSRKEFHAYTIGVCYPCQITDNIPVEPHDKIIDSIVSV